MPKPQGFCIFCGGAGLTHEHVWPNWTARLLPKNIPAHSKISTVIHSPGKEHNVSTTGKPIDGDPKSRRVRCVCGSCNWGWMSAVQDAVKPLAIPLITGRPATLGREDQHLLAMWIAMSVITSEFSTPKTKGVPESHRRWLYLFRRMPPNWKIVIGHYPKGMTEAGWRHESGAIFIDEDVPKISDLDIHPPNTQTSTYAIGQLHVHAFSSTHRSLVEAWKIARDGIVFMRQLWPVIDDPLVWPPPHSMEEGDVADMATRLHGLMMDMAKESP